MFNAWQLANKLQPAKKNAVRFPVLQFFATARVRSEQTFYLARFIDEDVFGCRYTREAGHDHDVTANCHDELGTCREAQFTDVNGMIFRCAHQ